MRGWLVVLLIGVAMAEEPSSGKVRAHALFKSGEAAYQAGRFEQAIHDYNEAFALVPQPLLLFDLGQAYRMNGELDKAIQHYQKYLDVDPQGRVANEARGHLDELTREQVAAAERAAAEHTAAERAAAERAAAERAAAERAAAERAAAERAAAERVAAQPQLATAPVHVVESKPRRPKWVWPVVGVAIGVVVVGVTVGLAVAFGGEDKDPRASWGGITAK